MEDFKGITPLEVPPCLRMSKQEEEKYEKFMDAMGKSMDTLNKSLPDLTLEEKNNARSMMGLSPLKGLKCYRNYHK